MYVQASKNLEDQSVVFTTYTDQLAGYIKRPSTLKFANTSLRQPAAQLLEINKLTDLTVAEHYQVQN